jgi:hypothetical protein
MFSERNKVKKMILPLSIIDYNSIKNGELVQASSIINENDTVNILFDCTDEYKTCKLYMHLLLLASSRPTVPSVWPSVLSMLFSPLFVGRAVLWREIILSQRL